MQFCIKFLIPLVDDEAPAAKAVSNSDVYLEDVTFKKVGSAIIEFGRVTI